jgi:nucleoside-triphosphatase THEP1
MKLLFVIIDENGKMECVSETFVRRVRQGPR